MVGGDEFSIPTKSRRSFSKAIASSLHSSYRVDSRCGRRRRQLRVCFLGGFSAYSSLILQELKWLIGLI
jgi:hypothetical protein